MTLMNLPMAAPATLNLGQYRLGSPQRAGALTVAPIFGPEYAGIASPRSGLKIGRVVTYGVVELTCTATAGVAIVPLHIGYIQDGAQNHALCRSAFIAAGQTLRLEDACCVQQSQGGLLEGREQWFFILPLELRAKALALRSLPGYSKLWEEIGALNRRYGLEQRGHLEQILTRQRSNLTQFQSRLELLPGQVGAVFFLRDQLVGLEVAPSAAFFAELWMPLVCFAYGVAAWYGSPRTEPSAALPFEASSLAELRSALAQQRQEYADQVRAWLAEAPLEPLEVQEEERYLSLRLSTFTSERLVGQAVIDGDRMVYASLFAHSN